MKLRNPLLIRMTALLGSWALRAWLGTLTYRIVVEPGSVAPSARGRRGIYVIWHEMLLLPTLHARHGFSVLASRHADGELIAQAVRMLGGHAVRGSTSSAGVGALRMLIRKGRVNNLAITPDGPRGPRRELKAGAVFLASKTGLPLIPVGFAVRECKRIRSWDRMVLPKPGTLVTVVIGTPVEVPPDLDREGIEQERLRAQAGMDEAHRRAESLLHKPPAAGKTAGA
jgi:lysophospholipid acyltransferase (LPLAT)-like uncharacterized protein